MSIRSEVARLQEAKNALLKKMNSAGQQAPQEANLNQAIDLLQIGSGQECDCEPSITLSKAVWGSMTDEEKEKYKIVRFLDDFPAGVVTDSVTEGNLNPVTSNAVFSAFRSREYDGAGFHNSIYRGKFLGDSYIESQKQAISSGIFADLYVGDYWEIEDIVYRIAAFDYWLNVGDTPCSTHHVVVVVDDGMYNRRMNDADDSSGGYYNSTLRESGLENAKVTIKSAFGEENILTHREFLSSSAQNGIITDGLWADCDIEIMGEGMVFGRKICGLPIDVSIAKMREVNNTQLRLFALRPDLIAMQMSWWLREPASGTKFVTAEFYGGAKAENATFLGTVRPVFAIC